MNKIDNFWGKVDKSGAGGCWLWTASLHKDGYGQCRIIGKTMLAHRVAYFLLNGPIAKGLEFDHLCRVRRCVNPDHLEPVTHKVNVLRGLSFSALHAKKPYCIRGHQLKILRKGKEALGWRECLVCKKQLARVYNTENADKIKKAKRENYQKNRDERLGKQKAYAASHKEDIKRRNKESYEKNKEARKAYQRELYWKKKRDYQEREG